METNNSANNPENNRKLTPAELIKKHMKDPNHVVTEEELKNVVVGDEAMNKKELDKDAKDKKDEVDHLPHNDDLPNPYSVLGT
jgi:hypothetical protein